MPITIAATQMACSWDIQSNIEKAINLVHKSADLWTRLIAFSILLWMSQEHAICVAAMVIGI